MKLACGVVLAAACAVGTGCAREQGSLVPVRSAQQAAGAAHRPGASDPVAAAREAAGLAVAVVSAAWEGFPAAAADRITPMQVSLQNRSDHAVLIRYRDFVLVGGSGRRYGALPPVPPEPPRAGTQVFDPVYDSYGFEVSPDLRFYYPTFPVAMDPFPLDRDGARAAYARWPEGLPTQDMREHALPEGVLEKHGNATGYLYFPGVIGHERRVALQAHVESLSPRTETATAELDFDVSGR